MLLDPLVVHAMSKELGPVTEYQQHGLDHKVCGRRKAITWDWLILLVMANER